MNPVHTTSSYFPKSIFILSSVPDLLSCPSSLQLLLSSSIWKAVGSIGRSVFNDLIAGLNSGRNEILSLRILPVDLVTEGRS
jgi:hypothetical protein